MKVLSNVRLTAEGVADASSIAAIVRDVTAPLGPAATHEQKVLALYRWVREHMFVFPNVPDDLHVDFNTVARVLNWWGYGLCGTHAKVLGMLAANLLGHANVRLVGMGEAEPGSWLTEQRGAKAFVWSTRARGHRPYGGQGHTSLEVRWDGTWHFLDVMVGFYRRDESGRVVGIDELLNNRELAERPVGDPDGDMPFGHEPEIFFASKAGFQAVDYNSWPGEALPLNLRPGERFVWFAEPVEGAWWVHPNIRKRFGTWQLAPGPRGHLPGREGDRWGNGEHVYGIELRPDTSDPFWCPETADWHVPVELPWPIMQIHWEMDAGCSGFLYHEPSTDDRLLPIGPAGNAFQPEDRRPATGYRIICRSPDRTGPMRLSLRTIVQLNTLVVPWPRGGVNVVTLSADGEGELSARYVYQLDGEAHNVHVAGAGEHRFTVGEGELTPVSIILTNESG